LKLIRRLAPYAVAVLVALAALVGLTWHPPTVSTAYRASYVIVVGAAGLRWDDINATDTPNLWALAQQDGIAALSVRSAHHPTCPSDGWVTLGAGDDAYRTPATAVDGCPPLQASVDTKPQSGAVLTDQERTVIANGKTAFDATPGALAEAVRCTVAVGPGAAIAAARPFGRIDQYSATLPADPTSLLDRCTLSIIDAGTIDGLTPADRASQAAKVDAEVGRLRATRPQDSLLLIAGLSDTDSTSRLHVAIADGPGYGFGWLTSTGTSRDGYVQLVDLAPTVLAALGQPIPAKLFSGSQIQSGGLRPADPASAVNQLADADHEAAVERGVAVWFFWALVVIEAALLVLVSPMLRRARRATDPGERPFRRRTVRMVEAGLVACAVLVAVSLLADLLPWWRAPTPGLLFGLAAACLAALVTAGIMAGPWRNGTLGPVCAVATLITAVIGVDVATGSHLQLNGIAGYSASDGARYAGIGPVALGAFIAGVLLLAACVSQMLPDRRWRPAVIVVVGGVGVVVVGSPYLGANAGGVVALTAGVCISTAIAGGGWLTLARLLWAAVAGLVALMGFALLDLRRSTGDRGSVGRSLTQLHQGGAGAAVHQTAADDVVVTLTHPLTLLVIVAIVFNLAVLIKPWGGLMRLFGLYPAVRGVLPGIAVAATLAGLLDGVGLATAGAAAASTLPLVTVAALRVLDHAEDRTVVIEQQVTPSAPDSGVSVT
jgi:hypothetical protein